MTIRSPNRAGAVLRAGALRRALGLGCAAAAMLVGACDEIREGEPNSTAPTAIAWLTPVGPAEVSGRALFVGRESLDLPDPSEIHFMLRLNGLEPGAHVLRLRTAAACADPADESGDLKQIPVEVGPGAAFEYEQDLESLEFSSDGGFTVGSVVVDVLDETRGGDAATETSASRRVLACGVVESLGLLRDEEGPPQQSP